MNYFQYLSLDGQLAVWELKAERDAYKAKAFFYAKILLTISSLTILLLSVGV